MGYIKDTDGDEFDGLDKCSLLCLLSTSMLTLSVVVPLWDGSWSVVFNVCSFLILTNYIQDLPYVVCTHSSMPL